MTSYQLTVTLNGIKAVNDTIEQFRLDMVNAFSVNIASLVTGFGNVRAGINQTTAAVNNVSSAVNLTTTAVNGTTTAVNGTTTAVNQTNSHMVNMNSTMTQIARNTGGFLTIFTQLTVVGSAYVKVLKSVSSHVSNTVGFAREHLKVTNLIEGAIRATGNAAGLTTAELKEMANEFQRTTNFGDHEILQKVSNVLLTFRNIQGEVFREAQSAIVDMSAALGTDLQSASMQVGKALQDPIEGLSALGRIGVRFTAEQKELIEGFVKTNDVASAQGIILQSLAQFKGQAQNVADPIIMLKNSFDDLRESIGLLFLPTINNVAVVLRSLVDGITDFINRLKEGKKDVEDAAISVGGLSAGYISLKANIIGTTVATYAKAVALKVATVAQTALNVAMKANPIGLVISAVSLLITGLVILTRRTIGFKQLWEYLVASFKVAWEWIKLVPNMVGTIFSSIFKNFKNLLNIIKALLRGNVKEAFNLTRGAIKGTIDGITGNFKNAVDNTKNIWSDAKLPPKEAPIEVTSPEEIAFQTQQALDARDEVIESRQDTSNDDLLRRFNDFNLALRDERQKLADELAEQTAMIIEFHENGLLTTAEYLEHEMRLNEEYQAKLTELRTKDLSNILAHTERKVKLGLATNDELLSAQSEYFEYVESMYDQNTDAYMTMLEKRIAAEREAVEVIKEKHNEVADIIIGAGNRITNGFSKGFADMITHGKSFGAAMKTMWRDLANYVISELTRMIAKQLIFNALKSATGLPIPFKDGGIVPGHATGGFISGPGTATSDSIPALLSNGEYVINAQKTSLFKPLLDLINYGSLSSINKALSSSLPRWSMPAIPRYAYATGGLVSGGFDLSGLEDRLDRVVNRLESLEQKDYNVVVKTQYNGITFHRDVKRAETEYNRNIKV